MNSFRVARAALRARPAAFRAPLQRRTYADAAPDKIKLSLALPHQSIYKSQDVVQVNIPAESGEMGVLANHVPSIEQLKPGLIEVIEDGGSSKQFFLSGGFAVVQPNSAMSINAIEGYPVEDFSAEAVKSQIAEAQKIANGSGSEQDIAEAKIELETLPTTANPTIILATKFSTSVDDGQVMEAADVTPLSASGIEPYDTLVFSIFDGPAPDLSPDSLIPTGTVSYRIRQLHGIIPQDRRPSKHPLFEWDRENMLIGWGRRSTRHTVKPEHSYTGLKIARWEDNDIHGYSQEIHHEHDHEHDSYEPTCIACTSNPAHVYSPPPQLRELELDLELPILTNNSNQMDDSKLKRKSARDLYQEYGISRPPGWLSDEEDSDLARESARKTVTPKQSNIVASRHDSPTRNVLSPELGKTILSGNGQEHISSRLDDVHMEREDNHRHHLVSLHGTPHVAEHLVDRFRNKLQNWSARHSPKLSKSTTPVHAIAEVSHHEYVEEIMLSGSPTHKELNGSITLPNDHTHHGQLSPLAAPVIQREFHKLRHVDSGAFERHASRTELDQLRHLARSRTTDSTSTQIHTVQQPHVKNATEQARSRHGHEWTESAEKQQRGGNADSIKLEKTAAAKITSWQQRIDDEGRDATQAIISTGDEIPTVPRGRLNSPPAWLKSHQKEPSQAWIHQKLRHVSSQGSHGAWRSHQPETDLPRRPKSSTHEDIRRRKSQVPVAERVKQLQHLDLSRKASDAGISTHVEDSDNISELHSSQTLREHATKRGLRDKTPVPFAQEKSPNLAGEGTSRGKGSKTRRQDLATGPAQHSTQSAREQGFNSKHKLATNITATNKRLEQFRRQDEYLQESYRQAISKAETELDRLREENKNGKGLIEQASSSRITASGFSTPSQVLQPRQLSFNHRRREQASDSHTSTDIASRRKEALMVIGKGSDLDLHRPSAVAPPTHECSWRDRYMALTAEIRQLKAEMSSVTRVLETTEREVMHEDRMLGIESVTIVMHLKDKDDLVINTDLTQECED
ncbi:delta subunit of the central stalk of mitochondrial F1F0 ATP synthase, atp16 [Neopestalotiopsis sp. 37M]|nr:delta subunit of the central stalk of mitochondrial F1F0 ATP synthase, atp16 [Neopestalotiopsis sp. 37M]